MIMRSQLTHTPYLDMIDKLRHAIYTTEIDQDIELNQDTIIESFDEIIDQFKESGLARNLQSFIDNMLVNFDYHEFVREFL